MIGQSARNTFKTEKHNLPVEIWTLVTLKMGHGHKTGMDKQSL